MSVVRSETVELQIGAWPSGFKRRRGRRIRPQAGPRRGVARSPAKRAFPAGSALLRRERCERTRPSSRRARRGEPQALSTDSPAAVVAKDPARIATRGGALDLLRLLASLLIVVYHFGAEGPMRIERFGQVFSRGFLATDFFLMLSGYVLGRAYGASTLTGGSATAASGCAGSDGSGRGT
jgi:hypothetical protein